ncbi:MAG TPA: hypothetical protein VMF50_17945 [Candidatus Binataceae bacterium]|nr:hypothetical protein [Candidatus Binataceae bacterium]
MSTDNSLAAVVPYGHFLDGGEVYLRGRGLMAAYELGGLTLESAKQGRTRRGGRGAGGGAAPSRHQ